MNELLSHLRYDPTSRIISNEMGMEIARVTLHRDAAVDDPGYCLAAAPALLEVAEMAGPFDEEWWEGAGLLDLQDFCREINGAACPVIARASPPSEHGVHLREEQPGHQGHSLPHHPALPPVAPQGESENTAVSSPAAHRFVRCPTEGAHDEHGQGCGHVFTSSPDYEGLEDCGNCGLFFPSNDPHAQVNAEELAGAANRLGPNRDLIGDAEVALSAILESEPFTDARADAIEAAEPCLERLRDAIAKRESPSEASTEEE